MKDPGAVKLSDSNWKFDSGLIAFDDAKYNIAYAQTAAGLLGAGNVAADKVSGSDSAKEITFTGTLVELPALKRCKRPFLMLVSTASSWEAISFYPSACRGLPPSGVRWSSTATGTR